MTSPYYQDDLVTLYLGDCLEITEWCAADVLVTDPPYGMNYVSGMGLTPMGAIKNDDTPEARDRALALWGDKPAIVFGTWKVPKPPLTRQCAIWHKAGAGPGMGDLSMPWGNSHEEIYLWGDGFTGKRRPSVITTREARGGASGPAAALGHPTPKPVGLMEQLIATAPPGAIADPFAGSGATVVAARNLGRPCVAVEIEERYCEGIAARLSQGVLL